MQHTEDAWSNQDLNVDHDYYIDGEAPVCIYYINGFCKWGSECRFSHSLKGQRTPCKFFYTLQVPHLVIFMYPLKCLCSFLFGSFFVW